MFLAAAITSSLVMRPSLPVPLMVEGSIPYSSTARRTAGERTAAPPGASSLLAAGAGAGAGAGASDFAAASFFGDGAEPVPSSIVAISAPTVTVSPSAAICSRSAGTPRGSTA